MKLDEYVIKDGKELRCGYTTGSCAIGATLAACKMLKQKTDIHRIQVPTPAGIELNLEVLDIQRTEDSVTCCIIKDAGDDPDVTDGIAIYSKVQQRQDDKIELKGGTGVGVITRKGLFGKVGESAINPVPKKILLEILEKNSKTGLSCEIFVPQGKEIAKKTYNQYLGIEGGISIIGTKGIVYPMSEEALLKTIYMEIDMIKEKYEENEILFTPGNYGLNVADSLNLKVPIVKISNYIGDALKYAYNQGFRDIFLIGHIGKFSKLSIGVFNTHSSVADTRMEAFIYYLALMGANEDILKKIDSLLTAEQALLTCRELGFESIVKKMEEGCNQRIQKYLKDETVRINTIIYSMS